MDASAAVTRVLAITANPSLVIGLTFLGRDWDVASHDDMSGLPDADVLVIDVGTTQAALELLGEVDGHRIPAVVVDDEPAEVAAGDRLLLRPYTLSELADQVDVVTGAAPAASAAPTGDEALTGASTSAAWTATS